MMSKVNSKETPVTLTPGRDTLQCTRTPFLPTWINLEPEHSYNSSIMLQHCCLLQVVYSEFTGKVMSPYSSNWFMILLLCTSAPLDLCGDRLKHEQVDLVTDVYDVSLCQRIALKIQTFDDVMSYLHGCVISFYNYVKGQ